MGSSGLSCTNASYSHLRREIAPASLAFDSSLPGCRGPSVRWAVGVLLVRVHESHPDDRRHSKPGGMLACAFPPFPAPPLNDFGNLLSGVGKFLPPVASREKPMGPLGGMRQLRQLNRLTGKRPAVRCTP
jgi:hypothetical protein